MRKLRKTELTQADKNGKIPENDEIFRPFSDPNRCYRLPFTNIQKNVALKRLPFTLANIVASFCVTDS